MHTLRYRQIHLDFHTSPAIPDVGHAFDKRQWQQALKTGHVDSITCFGVCHHGWSYNDTKVGERHPGLSFNLLRAQFDACKEIDVNVPIYVTAGVNNRIADAHPEWREITPDGAFGGWTRSPLAPGFRTLCFNSSYMDHLCSLIEELVREFPDCDGIFLDIISQGQCCCNACLVSMLEAGLDPEKEADRLEMSRRSLERYYRMTTAAAQCENPQMPIFHNSGHVDAGRRDILKYFSHLELESLPTGGWGYDHFPMSAKYVKGLGLDYLGMTGKFHTTWGEFGGYKHPNALRYECAAMLAYGAKCSVGDQLHPTGAMDESTYRLIGEAYAEVEAKESWCSGTRNVADVAVLSAVAVNGKSQETTQADEGACRILLEGHFLFDVIDAEMDFAPYAMLLLPDLLRVGSVLQKKLDAYLAAGGRLLLTGTSGLVDGQYVLDTGVVCEGQSPFQPDYVLPVEALTPSFVSNPLVMYAPSQRLRLAERGGAESLGDVVDPYFNRTYAHFCSHQHAPPRPEPSGYICGARKGAIMTLAHPVFTLYRGSGAVAHKEYAIGAIRALLADASRLECNLPSTARVSLMEQAAENRHVLHLLYASTVSRGGPMDLSGGTVACSTRAVEVVDELLPLCDTQVSVRLSAKLQRATLEPHGTELSFEQDAQGTVRIHLERFACHAMVVFHHER